MFSITHANELIEEAFAPAKLQETIINLGNTKDSVGNEIFRESVGTQEDAGQGCFVQGQKIDGNEVKRQVCEIKYGGTFQTALEASLSNLETDPNQCHLPAGGYQTITNDEKQEFCSTVLGGDWDVAMFTSRPPLIVRITKFLLRLVVVLSITMVIYTGVMYIIEASKGAEVKNARDNLLYIIGGVLLALMSLMLVNLITSLSVSSLNV